MSDHASLTGVEAAKVSFFKKSTANKNIRKRKAGLEDEDDDEKKQINSNEGGAIIIQKKPKESVDKSGLAGSTAAKRKEVTASNVFSTDASFNASGTAASLSADSATRTLDIDGADDVAILAGEVRTPSFTLLEPPQTNACNFPLHHRAETFSCQKS